MEWKAVHEQVDLDDVRVQQTWPIQRAEAVRELLGCGKILDPEKCVVAFRKADIVLLQFTGESFMSVDVDLDLEREPRLQFDVDQAGITINEIEVQEKALPARRSDKRFPLFKPE